jgi:hypothetical protein
MSFPGFPVGVARTLSLEGANPLLRGLSWRERHDQMRDWLLYTVVYSSGRSAQQVSRILYDVPPVRADYLQSVASFPSGTTRSAYLGNGEAVVLAPFEPDSARLEDLAQAADEHRKNLGKPLTWLHVFEYDLGAGGAGITVKRLSPVAASSLYTAAAGYRERLIGNLQDLHSFVAGINDLTFASTDPQGIRLGGRKLATATGIGLPEIAGVYQSDRRFRLAQQQIGQLIKSFNSDWADRRYSTLEEEARLTAQHDAARKEVEAKIRAIQAALGPRPASCGFSLDPYPEGTTKYLFQKATYTCDLQGTETGMVLFYTDLLAKLWAMDYQRTFPRNIPEFAPMTETRVSSIHRSEVERLPHTRIWFGPLEKGFQNTSSTLLFARTATRVFALSRVSSELVHEAPPNASSAAFMNWWNSHYDEIARWEPQYQKLNQIMKWSLVFAWLEAREASEKLAFLDEAPLNRSNWFPDWVRERRNLQFTAWDRVGFHPRGYAGQPAETMEILTSEKYRRSGYALTLSGGVGLGSREDFEKRKFPADSFSDVDRRGNVDYGAEGYPGRIVTLGGSGYQFHGIEEDAAVTTAPPSGAGLRGQTSEFGDSTVTLGFRRSGGELEVSTQVGGIDSLSLEFGERPNGFGMGRARGSTPQASSLLHALSGNTGPGGEMDAIMRQPNVSAAIHFPGGRFLVGFHGESRWLQVELESESGAQLEKGQLRLAGPAEDSRAYKGAWVSAGEASRQLSQFQSFRLERAQGTPEGVRLEVDSRGPPEPGGKAEVPGIPGGSEREGIVSLHRARSELPPDLLADPRSLERLLPRSDLEAFAQFMRDGDLDSAARELARDPLTYKQQLGEYRARGLSLGRQALDRGDYSGAIQRLSPLADINPSDPEVVIPLGIARILTGDSQSALPDLGAVFGVPLSDPAGFLKSLEDMTSRLPAAEQGRLAGIGPYVRFSDFAGRHPELKLGGFPYESSGHVRFVAQQEAMVRSSAAPSAEALASGAPRYAQDSVRPGAEWAPSPPALGQLTPQNISSAARAVDPVISRFWPAGIEYRRTWDHFGLINTGGPPAVRNGGDRIYFLWLRADEQK